MARVELLPDDLATVYGGPDALVLQSDGPQTAAGPCAGRGQERLVAGEERWLVLTYDEAHRLQPSRYPAKWSGGDSPISLDGFDRPVAPR